MHTRACNLCEAICGLVIEEENGRVSSIRADTKDPLSRGHICPKAMALKDIHEDPDRLTRPLRRTETGWEELSWDDALDVTAQKLHEIASAHGPDAVATYLGNPNVHNLGSMTHGSRMLGPLRTKNRFSATSVDQLPHQLLAYLMYGHQLLVPIPDVDRTDYFLVLGANPLASNGSLMTVPDFPGRMKELYARGGKMVVLDPRRTETAKEATEHHFIRPGGDAAFLLAVLSIIVGEGLARPEALSAMTTGLDAALGEIRGLPQTALIDACGLERATVERIARELASAKRAAVYGRMGVSVTRWGTLSQWAIQLLNIVTGNLDRPGGVLFTTPAIDLVHGPASRPGHFGRWKSRVRDLPEFAGELPVAVLAEEITTPGDRQVRALVTVAGNPVLSTPNGKNLSRALDGLGFMASVDFYLNETTRHAHVILPPTCTLEHDHYDLVFHVFAVRNTARYSPALFPRGEHARHDFEIFEGLGQRLAAKMGKSWEPFPDPTAVVDLGLRFGPYGASRTDGATPLDLESLAKEPHGVDLGPLMPGLPARLFHADKKIVAMPELLREELGRFTRAVTESAASGARVTTHSLLLIGRRHLRSNNSWLHNAQRLMKGPTRHELLMHPDDARTHGLASGARVRVRSRTGDVTVDMHTTDDMMKGVVSLPHGFGHDRAGARLSVASAYPGASNNDLTDETSLDVSGNAALNGVPVTVEPA